jgi:hypothetical protein
MNNPAGGTVGPGQVISLTRSSAWRREYEMRAGERALGWLRWQPGRRSFAQAEGRGIGPIDLATRRRRVVAASTHRCSRVTARAPARSRAIRPAFCGLVFSLMVIADASVLPDLGGVGPRGLRPDAVSR